MCVIEGCDTIPNFNVIGERIGRYCAAHKTPEMIDVKSKTCAFVDCRTIPNYNNIGETVGLYCATHKKPEMVDVKHKSCKNDWCSTIVLTKKYKGFCLNCFIHEFPGEPVSYNYKTKEFSVVEYINKIYPQLDWVFDKTIQGGTSRRRPDILLNMLYQVIIIEIDENQHQDYDCSCENKRTMELSQDLEHLPIVFIRFNPDDYMIKDKKITSCWAPDGNGVCTIKKSKKAEWDQRLESLKQQIDYWILEDNATPKTVEIVQLFYDQ